MERRTFIASAAVLIGAGAAHSARPGTTPQSVVRSYVTGISPEMVPVVAGLESGTALKLARARHRRFDPSSVEVRTPSGDLLGYLPGIHSKIIGPLLEHGLELHASMVSAKNLPRPAIQLDVLLSG